MTRPLLAELAEALVAGSVLVVDLTRTLSPATPMVRVPEGLAQSAPFRMTETSRYDERGPDWYRNDISCGEHTGTHIDAPVHWVTGRHLPDNTVDRIPPARMVAPVVVIDCTREVSLNEDFVLEEGHIRDWEARYGQIPRGAWVLMRSDWSLRARPNAYLNRRADGAHTPGPSVQVIRFLLEERDINGWGTEVVGADAGQSHAFDPPYPAHHLLLGANRYGLAGLCNLDQLPPTGALLISAPLKIENGSGSPLRVIALVPAG